MSGLRYIGDGAWIAGVPARDLNAEEAKQYADLIADTAAAGHVLYVPDQETATVTATMTIAATVDEAPPVKRGK
jgi:hypothetical protein